MIDPLEAQYTSNQPKPPSYPQAFAVPEALISWDIPFAAYSPAYFTDEIVLSEGIRDGWAEGEDFSTIPPRAWSQSYQISTDVSGKPLNPRGRTGIVGRGLLGKWGANYAVDILLSRVVNNELEFLLIRRGDNHTYAFVGGMVDGDENELHAAQRELQEETGLTIALDTATIMYKGSIGDYRSTDNAWIETTLFYLDIAEQSVHPIAADDAEAVQWVSVSDITDLTMHANHKFLLEKIIAEL